MKAGRELDALVAEVVMGCEFIVIEHCKKVLLRGELGQAIDFAPSTNLTDSWKVVNKIAETIGLYQLTQGTDYWLAEIQTATEKHWAEADTAPLAICLAALKAVGVEVDE